jgi:hypothetical protein
MSSNSRTTRILGALLSAVILAACSGGNPSSSSLPPTQTPFKWNGKVGKLNFRLKLPSKHRQAEIAKQVSRIETARGMKPNYFPGSATTLVFKLLKIGSTTATQPTPYNFTVSLATCGVSPNTGTNCTVVGGTAAAVQCTLSGSWSCTIHTNAPAASDTFLIETEDTSSGTKILSQSSLIIAVTAETPASGSFALDPVVSKLAWSSGWISDTASYIGTGTGGNSGSGNGSTEPTWTSGIGYTCPSAPTTYCSDPLVNGNSVATNDTLTLSFLDADNNTVLPVSGDNSPNIPIYVSNAGLEVNVGVVCNNPDIQWLNNNGGSAAVTYTTLSTATPSPGATANPTLSATPSPYLANGASSSFTGAATDFFGNGNPSSTLSPHGVPMINSPETGKDGTTAGGTDAKGSVISDAIWSNTGAYVNYDGGGNATSSATSWTCIAYPNTGPADATYYVGLAEGSISGARTLPIKIHRH